MQNFPGLSVLIYGNGHIIGKVTRREVNMQRILEQNLTTERVIDRKYDSLGTRIGFLGKLFGCWHKDLSRPFTDFKSSYRVCTDCGARKMFDTKNFKTLGTFYYPRRCPLDRNCEEFINTYNNTYQINLPSAAYQKVALFLC